MRKEILIIAIIVAIVSFATAATAAITGVDITSIANTTAAATTDDSVIAVGGNITNIDINRSLQTSNWAGFFGQVNGSLQLADGNEFYSWGYLTSGFVLFTNESTVDWDSLGSSIASTRETEDASLGLTGLVDSVNNTFTDTYDLTDMTIGGSLGTLGNQVSADTRSNGGIDWTTFIIEDNTNNLAIYGCAINSSGNENYAGTATDFQIMVPVNKAAQRTYYVFADLQ